MDPGHFPPPSPSQLPASHAKYHHPYFSPTEVELLSEKQRGKMSANQEKLRQQACGIIETVSLKIGFPRKTIATAQSLYHRFHLFFPMKDFNYYDVAMACLYVSSKMHDTLKKPRDILMVSYTVRFPDLAARSNVAGGEVEMDPATVEMDRQHLLGIERLVLETICFNFTIRMPFPYVIKIGKALYAEKKLVRFAWRLAVDSNRTTVPLQYPPHVVAIACIYLAALLSSFEQPDPQTSGESRQRSSVELAKYLGQHGDWEQTYKACVEDLEEICHHLLDLFMLAAQNPSASAGASPSTPSSPSPYAYSSPRAPQVHPGHPLYAMQHQHPPGSASAAMAAPPPPMPFKHDMLMRLKIHLREREHPARPREVQAASSADTRGMGEGATDRLGMSDDVSSLGKNEGTVRFLFGPERMIGAV